MPLSNLQILARISKVISNFIEETESVGEYEYGLSKEQLDLLIQRANLVNVECKKILQYSFKLFTKNSKIQILWN